MTDIYQEILAALQNDKRPVVATIVSSSGSTPVPPGAKLLLKEPKGIPIGTVGGGCIEADVIEAARQLSGEKGQCVIHRFTLTEDNVESGMLCGGNMDVLIEFVPSDQEALYLEVISRREAGRDCAVVTVIGPGPGILGKCPVSSGATGIDTNDAAGLRVFAGELPVSFDTVLSEAVHRQVVARLADTEREFLVEPIVGYQDLVIFGGGHVSRYVSRSAAMAGFRVTVIDERPEYANPLRFPEAYRTLSLGFDEAWNSLKISPSTSIVIVTRGHKFDEWVLERAVATPARYIGMIGSKRKVLATFSNLIERGISRECLRNVHAPLGLRIGAITAEEIGISVTAELIAVRRGVPSPFGAMSDAVAEFFYA